MGKKDKEKVSTSTTNTTTTHEGGSHVVPEITPVAQSPKNRNSSSKDETELLIPPINFSMVADGVYRSGFPNKKNLPFLKKIGIASVVLLCPETYSDNIEEWMSENNVQVFQVALEGNKEPFVDISEVDVSTALSHIVNTANHPILIHCNKGKHRTGCVVGCLRKIQNWSLTAIFDEYKRFAGTKGRVLDLQFIELFHSIPKMIKGQTPLWVAEHYLKLLAES
eukprot:c17606_g1_i1.p1 GENE.c17606_g1_i1~~c17606_g1_i1.p1  ORF type:complete len:223 (+),score=93.71 c17606_g1_i1:23-691(+)